APLIAGRLQPILQDATGGSGEDAIVVLTEALLRQLSTAVTIDSLVQVPVAVTSPFTTAPAPRLSGKLTIPQTNAPDNSFRLSTSKVGLGNGPSSSTSLFTVKSPAD